MENQARNIVKFDDGVLQINSNQAVTLSALSKVFYCHGCKTYHLEEGVTIQQVCDVIQVPITNVITDKGLFNIAIDSVLKLIK